MFSEQKSNPNQHVLDVIKKINPIKLMATTFPHVVEANDCHIVILSNNHYVVVEGASGNRPLRLAHEIKFDATTGTYSFVENSYYGIAKALRTNDEKQNNFVASINQQAGISSRGSPIRLGEVDFIFMRNIDNGITLADAVGGNVAASTIDILTCIKNALLDAAHLQDERLIVHIDIKDDNIMFPSGICIDFEFSARLKNKNEDYAVFDTSLQATDENIVDIIEDTDVPKKLFKKNGKVYDVHKRATAYQFASMINSIAYKIQDYELVEFFEPLMESLKKGTLDLVSVARKIEDKIRELRSQKNSDSKSNESNASPSNLMVNSLFSSSQTVTPKESELTVDEQKAIPLLFLEKEDVYSFLKANMHQYQHKMGHFIDILIDRAEKSGFTLTKAELQSQRLNKDLDRRL